MDSLELLRTYAFPKEIVKKSFYTFDLSTFEGQLALLNQLQLLDLEIVKQAFAYIFPEYYTKELDLKRARAELRAVLIDLLNTDNTEVSFA